MSSAPYVYSLSVESGPSSGREFVLGCEGSFTIGRDFARLHVALRDDAVSREHARISIDAEHIHLLDLRSRNGTCVNGTSVGEARLRPGDRLKMGSTELLLRAQEAYAPPGPKSGRTSRAALAGTIPETSLDDVLRMLVGLRKDATVYLASEQRAGCIRVAQGRICQAAIRGAAELPARKALYRMLAWEQVAFETHASPIVEDAIREELDALLLEGARQRDELSRLEPYLPPEAAVLVIVRDPPAPTLLQKDVIDAVTQHRLLRVILDRSPLDDATTARELVELQQKNVVLAVEPSQTQLVLPDQGRAIFGRSQRSDLTPIEGTPVVQLTPTAPLRKA